MAAAAIRTSLWPGTTASAVLDRPPKTSSSLHLQCCTTTTFLRAYHRIIYWGCARSMICPALSNSRCLMPNPLLRQSLACWSLTVRQRLWRFLLSSTTTRSGSPTGPTHTHSNCVFPPHRICKALQSTQRAAGPADSWPLTRGRERERQTQSSAGKSGNGVYTVPLCLTAHSEDFEFDGLQRTERTCGKSVWGEKNSVAVSRLNINAQPSSQHPVTTVPASTLNLWTRSHWNLWRHLK